MNKLIQSNFLIFFLYIFIGFFSVSCISTKQIRYFQDIPDSARSKNLKLPVYPLQTIHTDDILSVVVATTEASATSSVNAFNSSASTTEQAGFSVDSLGYIHMPTVGSIKVSGLTIPQATEVIKASVAKFFLDAVVVVKLRSFKISVLGEVGKPGILYISTPKVNMIDLLSLAGDLTPYAKRDNILLLRHNDDNTVTPYRVNLTNSSIFSSPIYYLQSNDVIYVEPTNSKAIASDQTFSRNLTIGTLGLSVLTTILYLFR